MYTMSHGLVCRVTVGEEEDAIKAIIVGLPLHGNCLTALAVRHEGRAKDNVHYHIVGEFKGKSVDVASNFLRRLFGVKNPKHPGRSKNGFLSCKAWDGDPKAVSYLFHEDKDAPLLIQYNFTDEYVQMCRDLNITIKAEIKGSKQARVRVHQDIVNEVSVFLRKRYVETSQPCSHKDIFMEYMRHCTQRQVNHPGKFQIEGYIRKIQLLVTGDDKKEQDQLYQSWYRDYDFKLSNTPHIMGETPEEQSRINARLAYPEHMFDENKFGSMYSHRRTIRSEVACGIIQNPGEYLPI